MDLKLQNQLKFDVGIDDVGEIVNILNVIKVKCASTSEKFRLLIGLLCEVDLSITNIEEHYEQVPPSLLQSSLTVGVVSSSGAMESPTDIHKCILLQQQQRLRLQLELLQAQRLQQALPLKSDFQTAENKQRSCVYHPKPTHGYNGATRASKLHCDWSIEIISSANEDDQKLQSAFPAANQGSCWKQTQRQ
ncbi:uncharacterized protein LOC119746512 [Patiria miniata]|uniref:Uncharacterized protein n=1 Tax=Patiria miniata TaxID=46514 RepID=A0A914BSZ5_PATMI|nr:uncharacterized protein LOC119746512 [Patiria miniata]